ncbi:CxC2 domain-containing protein [Mycena sanguinolenta]|uniref:CxC2 domain-containing protein n=1 Tax=Mycena sanguinolenta TaxID=230812 RepID=A0A8H6Y6C1_9AGAR|nr:CxC2 domain-containing protein [Mycena sanguinolenta]
MKRKQPVKKPTVRHFAPRAPTTASGQTIPTDTSTSARSTARIMLEKTRISQLDGHVSQSRSVVEVAASREQTKVRPDMPRERQPVYDWYSGGDVDVDRAEDEEEASREARDSDNPLRQWVEDYRTSYLEEVLRLEGRGDHRHYATCRVCGSGHADYRCRECLGGGELMCRTCIVDGHRRLPFHSIEHWTGAAFERLSLKELGLRIQLGHWHDVNRVCPVPQPAFADDFVIIDIHGVHQVALDYCGCGQGGHPTRQLLRSQLWPATTTNPKTAATFAVLRLYHLVSFEAKCSALEFYQSLARQTDNLGLNRRKRSAHNEAVNTESDHSEKLGKMEKERYHGFLRMTRQWRHIRMLKRAGRGHDPAGIANTKPGECALLCPACPQPGKNLPPNWRDVAETKKFLYALFLAIDANFRLKRKDVSSETKDPGLGNGWAFFCEVQAYMRHVEENWDQKQDRSHCVAHDAVDKPDREARGTASSGIGAVDCARHNMKRPNAVGDLQLGERYLNMDYMFFKSIAGTDLVQFFVSYDIACQWHINIWKRMAEYKNEAIMIDGKGKFMTFLIPKFHLPAHIEKCNLRFSFHLTPYVGQTDGEAPERGWADANPLARSTKEMGPGARRDTLDDHFNDWNHKKIVRLGHTLRKKTEDAVPEMVKTRQALHDVEESLGESIVQAWTTMAEEWEKDETKPNPFETLRKDAHVAKVRAELAEEAAAREAGGLEELGSIRGDMHITELLAMGLQLEDQQRILASDVSSTGLHPTDGQRRAMTERTSKLRRKIFTWITIQTNFFPGLQNVRQLEDEERARVADGQSVPGINVSDLKLWLPSAIAAASPSVVHEVPVSKTIQEHEYRLRVGQANEALHEVRRLLLVRTHLYKMKDTQSRGVRANMRSQDKIVALNNQIERAAAQYRVAWTALATLGAVLRRREWERTLKELKADDVRGLPQSQFHDPERKKKSNKRRRRKKPRVERPVSWIWITQAGEPDPADGPAMNEAVRIDWAKTRARCHRWREEVDLLEEEMARVLRYCDWQSSWWMQQQGRRQVDNTQLEGETAYAVRQAAIQTQLARGFLREWAHLPTLIRQGRAEEVETQVAGNDDREESDGEESDDEEDEAISRWFHPTSVPAAHPPPVLRRVFARAHCTHRLSSPTALSNPPHTSTRAHRSAAMLHSDYVPAPTARILRPRPPPCRTLPACTPAPTARQTCSTASVCSRPPHAPSALAHRPALRAPSALALFPAP